MKRFVIFSVCLAVSISALAGGLSSKYRDWDKSPLAQFMTAEERAQWKAINTDGDAEAFVAAFKARRVAGFENEVDKRAAMADKYLTIGKTQASATTRGKIVILFGPPAKVELGAGKARPITDAPVANDAVSNVSTGFIASTDGGNEDGAMLEGNVPTKSTSYRPAPTIYTFTFNDPKLMKVVDKKELVVQIEADSVTGRERLSKKAAAELEKLFQLVAESSIISEPAAQQ